jgi:hypothetical protein
MVTQFLDNWLHLLFLIPIKKVDGKGGGLPPFFKSKKGFFYFE